MSAGSGGSSPAPSSNYLTCLKKTQNMSVFSRQPFQQQWYHKYPPVHGLILDMAGQRLDRDNLPPGGKFSEAYHMKLAGVTREARHYLVTPKCIPYFCYGGKTCMVGRNERVNADLVPCHEHAPSLDDIERGAWREITVGIIKSLLAIAPVIERDQRRKVTVDYDKKIFYGGQNLWSSAEFAYCSLRYSAKDPYEEDHFMQCLVALSPDDGVVDSATGLPAGLTAASVNVIRGGGWPDGRLHGGAKLVRGNGGLSFEKSPGPYFARSLHRLVESSSKRPLRGEFTLGFGLVKVPVELRCGVDVSPDVSGKPLQKKRPAPVGPGTQENHGWILRIPEGGFWGSEKRRKYNRRAGPVELQR